MMSFSNKMPSVEEDFAKLSKILPFLSIEKVIAYYRTLPPEKQANRMQHLLEQYLIPFGEAEVDELQIIRDCHEIQKVLPHIPESVIKFHLVMIGNEDNRRQTAVTHILRQVHFTKFYEEIPPYSNRSSPVPDYLDHEALESSYRKFLASANSEQTFAGLASERNSNFDFWPSTSSADTTNVYNVDRTYSADTINVFNVDRTYSAETVVIDDQTESEQLNDTIVIDDSRSPDFNNTDNSNGSNLDYNNRSPSNNSDDSAGNDEEPLEDYKLYSHLMEIFPDADQKYLRKRCAGKEYNVDDAHTLISDILSKDYPKRQKNDNQYDEDVEVEMDFEKQFEMLKDILPDADPTYLRMHLEAFGGRQELFKMFVSDCLEKRDYPTMKEYLRKQQLSAQMRQYTDDFSIENFIKIIPEPKKYFSDKNRKSSIEDSFSRLYAKIFLRNRYPYLRIYDINQVFANSPNLYMVCRFLDRQSRCLKSKRKPIPQADNIQDIPLLQEIAYIVHEEEIDTYLKDIELEKRNEFLLAKANGQLLTCECCYDEEVLPREAAECEKQCIFCISCIQKSVEIKFGEGQLDFGCLTDCDSYFSLKTLQTVLEPKIFSKIALRKQVEEVKAAGIEGLEMCPFCDFATIPAEGDRIFHCLNPECMKESCRLCKEPSHIPLKCDEVEKDADVKLRVYVENIMTEAMLRKCHRCDKKYIKTEGCNKMVCNCGAMMCYICSQPVKDYTHFNGQGGDQYHLCPLYSDDETLHMENALEAAFTAKADIDEEIKNDPIDSALTYYENLPKKQKTSHNPN